MLTTSEAPFEDSNCVEFRPGKVVSMAARISLMIPAYCRSHEIRRIHVLGGR
jgi:hypothetical protein